VKITPSLIDTPLFEINALSVSGEPATFG